MPSGDVFLTMAGEKAEGLRLFEVRSLLCEKDRKLVSRVGHGEEERDMSLVLARVPPMP
jgi:hypothetical protein